MAAGGKGGAGDAVEMGAELGRTLKEGERILPPTRRPDGTLRKPIRIRPGYVPQDEVPIYQSKGAIWKKEMSTLQVVPPGSDPVGEPKPKSKSAKRNERKKEKRQQAALEKGKSSEQNDTLPADDSHEQPANIEEVSTKIDGLSLSGNASLGTPPPSTESSSPGDQVEVIDKKIRALKKKIRQTEAQQQKTAEEDMNPEQLEKVAKLEGWRNELKLLEDEKARLLASSS